MRNASPNEGYNMNMIKALLTSMTVLAILAGSGVGHAAQTPTEAVKSALDSVMQILNEPTFERPGMSDARRAAIENVVRSFVSYQDMARRSLGLTWEDLN